MSFFCIFGTIFIHKLLYFVTLYHELLLLILAVVRSLHLLLQIYNKGLLLVFALRKLQIKNDFRCLDFNPNKQYMLATTGDDGGVRFWDFRHPKLPVQIRSDHSHWVWSVKYNQCHDQVRKCLFFLNSTILST